MLERTIRDISGIPTRVVTAEDLDLQYMEIYKKKYNPPLGIKWISDQLWGYCNNKTLLRLMEPFTIDLCMYLRGNDIHVTEVTICLEDVLKEVVLEMKVTMGNQFSRSMYLPAGAHLEQINLKVLNYRRYKPINKVGPQYGVTPHGRNYYANGVSNLIAVIQGIMGLQECKSCYYADPVARYCGLGMEMQTGTCQRRKDK